ncbi:hypothetical protein B0A55_04010 [Friedmanniomyces simplex]|uniref:Uncharacterized protein n=1 Tax=Friedmanniomyces simplex TaxID=329884 RepID=A0A4U0XMD7_9PEZI|nr:hypothetical protein B0A55_04010 [Friedmanniomyces simplex]
MPPYEPFIIARPAANHPHHAPNVRPSTEDSAFRAYANSGTPYDADEAELAFLQDPSVGPHTPGCRPLPVPMSREAALALLKTPPVVTDDVVAAIERLRNSKPLPHASYDLPIKMFNDLDTVLFHGQLKRRINLRWSKYEHGDSPWPDIKNGAVLGVTCPAGDHGQPRVAIHLNVLYPWVEEPRDEVVR